MPHAGATSWKPEVTKKILAKSSGFLFFSYIIFKSELFENMTMGKSELFENMTIDEVVQLLPTFSNEDLSFLSACIGDESRKRRLEKIKHLKEQIISLAGNDIKVRPVYIPKYRRSETVTLKYVHPEYIDLKWTGKGRMPKWIHEWIKSGKSLEELRIK